MIGATRETARPKIVAAEKKSSPPRKSRNTARFAWHLIDVGPWNSGAAAAVSAVKSDLKSKRGN